MVTAAETFRRALDLHRAGDLARAENLYRALLALRPDHAEGWHLLGLAELQRERPGPAADCLRRAVERGARGPGPRAHLGSALRELGRTQEALDTLRRTIADDPDYAPARYHLALALDDAGRSDEARDQLERVLRLDPDFAEAHDALARHLVRAGRLADALAAQSRAVALRPRAVPFRLHEAALLRQAGRVEEAEPRLRSLVADDPRCASAFNDLGALLRETDRLDEARDCFEQAVSLDPRAGEAVANLASALAATGRHEEAFARLREAIALLPDHPQVRCELARELHRRRRGPEALAEYRGILAQHPQHAPALCGLGQVLLESGAWDEARDLLESSLSRAPEPAHDPGARSDAARVWKNLSRARGLCGDVDGSIAAARRAVDLDPDDLGHRTLLAAVLTNAGRFDEACAAHAQVLDTHPDEAGTWLALGTLHILQSRPADAERCLSRAGELAPQEGLVWANLAELARSEAKMSLAAERFAQGFDAARGDRLRLQDAFLLPQIYDSPADLESWRDRLLSKVDSLHDRGVRYDAATGPVPTAFYLAYQGRNERDTLQRIAGLVVSSHPPCPAPHERTRRDDGRIHVAFASHHLYSHTIGMLNAGLIERLDRTRFHVSVLATIHRDDPSARAIRALADRYVVLTEDVPTALRLASALEPDVLFYTDLGMDPTTLALARSRLAPLQVTTWGHPLTTGLPTIDDHLSAASIETDEADAHYVERLVRLPALPSCYRRPGLVGPLKSRDALGLPESDTLYACPQSLFKFHPEFDAVLAAILRSDPEGHLVCIGRAEEPWVAKLKNRWRPTFGESALRRTIFLPRLTGPDFLNLLAVADVLLDPLHFGGGNTVYQGWAMGTPTVTCPSPFQRGRVALGAAVQCGVLDTVASDTGHYVELALRTGRNREFRAFVRARIAENSPRLFDDLSVVRAIETHLVARLAEIRTRAARRERDTTPDRVVQTDPRTAST